MREEISRAACGQVRGAKAEWRGKENAVLDLRFSVTLAYDYSEMKKPLSAKEAGVRLGISDARIRRLCLDGRIPGAWKMGRDWMIPEPVIKKMAENRKRAAK